MKITRDQARRIADLAHLEFDDESLDRLAVEMTSILGYIERLRHAEGEETALPDSAAARLRQDDIGPTLNIGQFFIVPKVIE